MYRPNIDKPIQKASAENDFPSPIFADERILELITMAMEDEATDAIKYKKMSESAPDQDSSELLRSMYLDENRHKKLFGEIYSQLSGTEPPEIEIKEEPLLSYDDQLKKNILSEIEGARFFRDIYLLMYDRELSGIVNGMLNDEQNHALINNYLLKK